MGTPVPLPIPVSGPLDTTNPQSSVPEGTLIQATDVAHRWMGPREGHSTWNSVGAVSGAITNLPRAIYELDGTDDYWLHPYLAEQMEVGLQWTLDAVIEPKAVGSTSGTIFSMGDSTHTDIHLRLLGTGSGGDERKVRVTVHASTSGGASGSAISVTGTEQLALASAGTPLGDFSKLHHIRVTRNGTALSLKVNGTEATGTGVNPAVGHTYVGDGFYVGTHSTAANNYLGGWVHKVVLRAGVFTDIRDGWFECVHPKHPSVLFCTPGHVPWHWAGGSTGLVAELSRFRNAGVTGGTPSTDNVSLPGPWAFPMQGISKMTTREGVIYNVVVCAGTLFYQRAT